MAVHFTIYPEEHTADALRRFMTAHDCSATAAIGLLLTQHAGESNPSGGPPYEDVRRIPRLEVA